MVKISRRGGIETKKNNWIEIFRKRKIKRKWFKKKGNSNAVRIE